MIHNKLPILFVIALAFFGYNNSSVIGNIFGHAIHAKFTSLDFYGQHKNGQTITITSECNHCDAEDISYQLWIDSNDDHIFTQQELLNDKLVTNYIAQNQDHDKKNSNIISSSTNLTITPQMLGHLIRIEVSSNGAHTQSLTISPPQGLKNIVPQPLSSAITEFAALTQQGTVVTWGHGEDSNSGSYYDVKQKKHIQIAKHLTHVQNVYSSGNAFSALLHDGTVKAWGKEYHDEDNSYEHSIHSVNMLTDVKEIVSTVGPGGAFAALLEDGSVKTWGVSRHGGDGTRYDIATKKYIQIADNLSDVKKIYRNYSAFAALSHDGTVKTWGDKFRGGDGSYYDSSIGQNVQVADTLNGVKEIYSNNYAFAALLNDGSIKTWGDSFHGGDGTYTDPHTKNLVQVTNQLTGLVENIYTNGGSFTAQLKDGSYKTWGSSNTGGDGGYQKDDYHEFSSVTSFLNKSQVNKIYSTHGYEGNGTVSGGDVFVTLLKDGSVKYWGGNNTKQTDGSFRDHNGNSVPIMNALTNVKEIIFGGEKKPTLIVALLENGTIKTWGGENQPYNLIPSTPSQKIENLHNVKKIVANSTAFAILSETGDINVWSPYQNNNFYDANGRLQFADSDDVDISLSKDIVPVGNSFAIIMKDGSIHILSQTKFSTLQRDKEFGQLNNYNKKIQTSYLVKESTL